MATVQIKSLVILICKRCQFKLCDESLRILAMYFDKLHRFGLKFHHKLSPIGVLVLYNIVTKLFMSVCIIRECYVDVDKFYLVALLYRGYHRV